MTYEFNTDPYLWKASNFPKGTYAHVCDGCVHVQKPDKKTETLAMFETAEKAVACLISQGWEEYHMIMLNGVTVQTLRNVESVPDSTPWRANAQQVVSDVSASARLNARDAR